MTHDELIEALQEHVKIVEAHKAGKKIEFFNGEEWLRSAQTDVPRFGYKYRITQEPLECWMNVYDDGVGPHYRTKEQAEEGAGECAVRTAVHMREVV